MSCAISIITATLNSAATIRDCLESIRMQRAPVEQIIIDGGSVDATLDIVRTFPHVAKIMSGPDNGIYDAINKGIAAASGDIVGILNSDDFYVNPDVLKKVVGILTYSNYAACYGDLVYVNTLNTSRIIRYWQAGSFADKKFYWGWMPPHPTFFVKRSMYERYGFFNLEMGTAADYELMLRFLVKYQVSAKYIPEILVKMRIGGASNASLKNRIKANRMDRLAWDVNGLTPFPWTTFFKPLSKTKQFFVRRP